MQRQSPPGRGRRGLPVPKWLLWVVGILAVLLVLALLAAPFFEERVRATIEGQMNQRLDGYSVRLPDIDLHLIGFAISLKGLVITQDAHPDPPVARIGRLRASVEWRQLLRGRLVADFLFDQPVVYLNLPQLRQEMEDEVRVEDRGWREALEAAYPLDFNLIRVRDGELTYIDRDPDRPLQARQIQFLAEDILTASTDGDYPSPFSLEAQIFTDGHGSLTGRAAFLAEPAPELAGRFELRQIPLEYFGPVLGRINLIVTQGVGDGAGELELGEGGVRRLHFESLTLEEVKLDYILAPEDGAENDREEKENGSAEAVEKVTEGPDPSRLLLQIDELRGTGELGLVNKGADPEYRIFLYQSDLRVSNYSNHFLDGPAQVDLQALFMGSGEVKASATFRSEQEGPDFDLQIGVVDTRLPAMNDLLRAYGNFDVVAGFFSFFAELKVRGGHIEGYMRPLFRDMEVYDRRQDEDKGLFQKLYEGVIGAISGLLENTPRDEVATQVEISGPLDDPDMSTLQIIAGLVRNAFFQAILPGFEAELP
ncbi:MAG: DUF748 domain-containing protein [Desulfuromonadales bacterium]|nr:DUF748 domain-containing protein [Desulfuromonadales bacterium]